MNKTPKTGSKKPQLLITPAADDKVVAIIHYNTPELTEATILSLRKHGGEQYKVVVFDNSDERPFNRRWRGVKVLDNTKGAIIDFDKELERFPERCEEIGVSGKCIYGSAKHMMTVQKLWELLPNGFLLLESDVLLKKSIDEFFNPAYSFVAHVQKVQPYNPFKIGRILPMCCYFNVPKFKSQGVNYFDPHRSYGLLPGGKQNRNNWYDTGASLLEDVLTHRPHLKGLHIDIRQFIEHYTSGSWQRNSLDTQKAWLNKHITLWQPPTQPTEVAVCAIGRLENRYAVEWVEHYLDLGIDKIFIYDNNRPEDGEVFADILQPYIDAGLVEITNWDGLQKPAYEDCYNKHSNEYAWIGFFDFDEHLVIDGDRNIHAFLEDFEDADVVVINWRTMTDNEKTHYEPLPLVERFTKAAPKNLPQNRHTKCFVHGGICHISFNDPHCPNAPQLIISNVLGERVKQIPIQPRIIHTVAHINHYDTKSAEEWMDKLKRGSCCGEKFTQRKRETQAEYFFSINKRTAEKEQILGITPPSKQ